MTKTIDWQRLFSPRFWLQNDPTDWEWDAALNRLMDKYPVTLAGACTVYLGGVEVWVGNYPYAYGNPYSPQKDVLPSVATRKRLKSRVDEVVNKKWQADLAKAEATE